MCLTVLCMRAQSPMPDGMYYVELFRVIVNDKDVITEQVSNDQCFMSVNDMSEGGKILIVYMMNYPALTVSMSDFVAGENGTTYFTATDAYSGLRSTCGVNALDDGRTFHVVINRGNGRTDVFTVKRIEGR